jgi:HSP20 family molecular chaperone IbpA
MARSAFIFPSRSPTELEFPAMNRRIDPTDWMWSRACDLIAQAEHMHRQFFRLASSAGARAMWEPPVDVFEDEGEVVIVVALPGVVEERIEILNEPGALVVRAERPVPLSGSRQAVRQLEIPYGLFERRIPLPGRSLHFASREITHGCLVLRLRKAG